MFIKSIKRIVSRKREQGGKKFKIKKWIKRWLLAQLVTILPYILTGLFTIIVCIIVSATVTTTLTGDIGDLSSVWKRGSTKEKCSCGDCAHSTDVEVQLSSGISLDYARLLSSGDDTDVLYSAQIMQLCETLQSKYNFPAVLLVYAMQHMESSGLISPSVMMESGKYNIYKYSCKEKWVSVPGGRRANSNYKNGVKIHPEVGDTYYNRGAYGFLQIEGDIWVSGNWTKDGVSKVTINNYHLQQIKDRRSEVISLLSDIGHSDIYNEYTNINGTKNTDFDSMVVDMGYLPFQVIVAVYDSISAKVYEDGASIFPEYWNELSESEKRVAQTICLLSRWNAGSYVLFDSRKEECNSVLQKFIIDLSKYLCAHGSSVITGSGCPESLFSGSNVATESNELALQWIVGKVYGVNSQEYTDTINVMREKLFYNRTKSMGSIYSIKAITCAQHDFDKVIGKLGSMSVSIYNLPMSGGVTAVVNKASCGCQIPCPNCDCHGEYNGNTALALDRLDIGNDTSGYAYDTLSMTNNSKEIIEAGVEEIYKKRYNKSSTQARVAAAGEIKSKLSLTVVDIQCWDWEGAGTDLMIENNFNKVTCNRKIVVDSALAGVVKQLFADIYRHPTKPVIARDLLAFRGISNGSNSTTLSTHSFGIAIDVNHCGYRDTAPGTEFNGAYFKCIDAECSAKNGLSLQSSGTEKLCTGKTGAKCGGCGKHMLTSYSNSVSSNMLWSFIAVRNGDKWHVYSNGYVKSSDIQLVDTNTWYADYQLISDTSYCAKKLMQQMMTSDGVITKIMNAYGFIWNLGDTRNSSDAQHYQFVGRNGSGCSLEALAINGESRNPLSPEFWKAENWPDTTEGSWDYNKVGPSTLIKGRAPYYDGVLNVYDENGNNIASTVKSNISNGGLK